MGDVLKLTIGALVSLDSFTHIWDFFSVCGPSTAADLSSLCVLADCEWLWLRINVHLVTNLLSRDWTYLGNAGPLRAGREQWQIAERLATKGSGNLLPIGPLQASHLNSRKLSLIIYKVGIVTAVTDGESLQSTSCSLSYSNRTATLLGSCYHYPYFTEEGSKVQRNEICLEPHS